MGRRKKQYFPKKKQRQLTRYQQRQLRRQASASGAISHSGGQRTPPEKRITIQAPKVLSIRNNAVETIEFVRQLRQKSSPKTNVHVDCQATISSTSDGLLTLIAAVRSCAGTISGNLPDEEYARAAFVHSGVFKQVEHIWPDRAEDGEVVAGSSGTSVDPGELKPLIKFATGKLGQQDGAIPVTYKVLVECMANTNNHAARDGQSARSWYTHVFFDPKRQVACFTFLDFGVGIVRSLRAKGFMQNVRHAWQNDGATLYEAFKGAYRSRTGRDNRGLGLPEIRRQALSRGIDNAFVVANRGYLDLCADRSHLLAQGFPGTLICWEVDRRHVLTSPQVTDDRSRV